MKRLSYIEDARCLKVNRWASIAEGIDNCQYSLLHIHTSRILYHIKRLSDESMINQEGLERKVKPCNMFEYKAMAAFSKIIIEKLTSVHAVQLVDSENIQLLQ